MDIKHDLTNIQFLVFTPERNKSIEEIMVTFTQKMSNLGTENIINISVSGDFDINNSETYVGYAKFIIFYKK